MSIGALGGHYSVPLTPVFSLFFLQRLEQLFSSWKIWDPRVLFSLAKCSKCLQCCWFHFLLPATISMIFLFLNHVLLFSFVLESTIFVSRSDLFMRVLLLLKWAFRYCACSQIFGVCFFFIQSCYWHSKKVIPLLCKNKRKLCRMTYWGANSFFSIFSLYQDWVLELCMRNLKLLSFFSLYF